jgi:parallel beta-helix repeat protein
VAVPVFLVAVALSVLAQEPCTVTVQPGESIQAAIDASPEGAVICLADGGWEENITITKSLTLVGGGPDRSSISGHARGVPVIRIDGAAAIIVTMKDLSVRDAAGGTQECMSVYPEQAQTICADGVAVMGHATADMENVSVEGSGRMGVYATDYSTISLRGCHISGSGRIGFFVRRYAVGTAESTIITGNNEGAMVADSASMTLESCEVTDSHSYGLYVGGQPTCVLRNCTIARNGNNGIALADSPQLTLTATSVTENTGWGVLKLAFPWPYRGVLSIDAASDLTGNELGEVGTR